MRKINLLILILLLLLVTLVLAAKIVPMPDIIKADTLLDLISQITPRYQTSADRIFNHFFVPGLPGYNDPLPLCHRWGETISIG